MTAESPPKIILVHGVTQTTEETSAAEELHVMEDRRVTVRKSS